MKGISVVIITKNEALNLGRCLASIQGIADEIVVVDSYSTDDTKAIALSYKATFVEHPWEGYAKTKNFANSLAKYSHILWLDADEALSPELHASLLQAKTSLEGGYSINRLNNYCGTWIRHGGWYPDRKLRLFPREKATWKGDFVHETLEAAPGLNITQLKGDLLHYTYTSVDDHRQRAEKYGRLGAQKIAASSRKGLGFKAIFSPPMRFIKSYIFQLGVLDGAAGFRIARMAAFESRLKYREAIRLRHAAQ